MYVKILKYVYDVKNVYENKLKILKYTSISSRSGKKKICSFTQAPQETASSAFFYPPHPAPPLGTLNNGEDKSSPQKKENSCLEEIHTVRIKDMFSGCGNRGLHCNMQKGT